MKARILLVLVAVVSVFPVVACGDDDSGGGTAQVWPSASQTAVASSGSSLVRAVEDPQVASSLPDLIDEIRASVVTVLVDNGEGSGVVWSNDGDIVTNNHVVEGTSSVEVVLASGEHIPATVVATDPLTDLAVIHVDRTDLRAAKFSKSLPRVGTLVLAVGNPLGFESSVSLGIVSGLNREIPSGGTTPALVDLLQTDAAISPGNSGGALIDLEGNVVGVNVAYIPPSQQAVSIGFAIPAVTARDVVQQLIDKGTVEHAFLGIEPRPLTPQIASQLGLSVSEGVFVFDLTPGGPADRAGVESGDVVVEFDGRKITSVEDLYAALRETSPGDTASLKLIRQGKDESVDVRLANRPS